MIIMNSEVEAKLMTNGTIHASEAVTKCRTPLKYLASNRPCQNHCQNY